jgi:hypothetical protein
MSVFKPFTEKHLAKRSGTQNLHQLRANARVLQVQPGNKRDKFHKLKALQMNRSKELQVSKNSVE